LSAYVGSRVEQRPAIQFEIDITDNILKHLVGCSSGLMVNVQLQKIGHEWLHMGRCRFLKFYLFVSVTETDRTTIKIQINCLPSSLSQSRILFALLIISIFDIGEKYYILLANSMLMKEMRNIYLYFSFT
jgi:hypothetical protein